MASDAPATPVIFTGPIDAYFGHALGALEWRSIRLEFQTLPLGNAQGAAVINYQSPRIPYTRVHEFRHLHPERDNPSDATVIAQEYSYATDTTDPEDLPYYPVRTERNLALLRAYRARATAGPPPWPLFAGRLGSYLYLDMDMAIAAALSLAERLWGGDPHRSDNPPPSVRLMEEAAGHAPG